MTSNNRKRFLSPALPLTALWVILGMQHLLPWTVSGLLIAVYLGTTAVTLVKSYRRDIRAVKAKRELEHGKARGLSPCPGCTRYMADPGNVYCPDCTLRINGGITANEYRERMSVPLATGPSVSGGAVHMRYVNGEYINGDYVNGQWVPDTGGSAFPDVPGWHRCEGKAYKAVRFCPVHGDARAEPLHQLEYLADKYELPMPVVTEPQKESLPDLGRVDETAGLTDAQVLAVRTELSKSLEAHRAPVVLPSNSFASVTASVQAFSDSQLLAAALADVLAYVPEGQAELSAGLLEHLGEEIGDRHSSRGLHWETSAEWLAEIRKLRDTEGGQLLETPVDTDLLFGIPVRTGPFGIPRLVRDAPYSYFAEKRMHKP